jgi:hypothetical protein
MSKNLIFFFASIKEANSLLFQSVFKFVKVDDYFLYEQKNVKIFIYITGVGKENVYNFCETHKHFDNALFFKPGTCALLNKNISLLEAFIPEYTCFDSFSKQTDFENIPKRLKIIFRKDTKLSTSETPVLDKEKAIALFKKSYDAVDMESFFVIEKTGCKVIPILVGTDYGDNEGKSLFFKNISKASEILKQTIEKTIDNFL